jgi:hypothetical protein
MTPYLNKSGNSRIFGFETTANSLTVEFENRIKFLYDEAGAGAGLLERMKSLAIAGKGLGTFIDMNQPPYTRKK